MDTRKSIAKPAKKIDPLDLPKNQKYSVPFVLALIPIEPVLKTIVLGFIAKTVESIVML
jgi:hypothetical protein